MIPVGYMAKKVQPCPEWLKAEQVLDVYSVSNCFSKNFADYIKYWKHNGFWFFDSPGIIQQLAQEHSIDLGGTSLFYYEVHELEFMEDENRWEEFEPEPSYTTLNDQYCLRIAIANHRSTQADFDLLAKEVVRIGKEITAQPGN